MFVVGVDFDALSIALRRLDVSFFVIILISLFKVLIVALGNIFACIWLYLRFHQLYLLIFDDLYYNK